VVFDDEHATAERGSDETRRLARLGVCDTLRKTARKNEAKRGAVIQRALHLEQATHGASQAHGNGESESCSTIAAAQGGVIREKSSTSFSRSSSVSAESEAVFR